MFSSFSGSRFTRQAFKHASSRSAGKVLKPLAIGTMTLGAFTFCGTTHLLAAEDGRSSDVLSAFSDLHQGMSNSQDTFYIQQHALHRQLEKALRVVLTAKGNNPTDHLADELLKGTTYSDEETGRAIRRIRAIKELFQDNLAMKHFDFTYFYSLPAEQQAELLRIVSSGMENPDSSMGCYAMHPTDYDKFKPFFAKVIAGYHHVPEDTQHVNDWSLDGVEGAGSKKLDLSELGLPALSMRVRVGRNLADFPLPGSMSQEDRVTMEKKMCEAFDVLIKDPKYGGQYYSLTPGHPNKISDEKYDELVKSHLMFKDMSQDSFLVTAGIAKSWPYGRGCYVSADKGFIVWVGEEDHLRIMCMQKGTVLNDVFDRLKGALDSVEAIPSLSFAKSPDFGYVTSCPTNLGTGMRASVHVQLPKLTADGTDAKAKAVAKPLGLSVRGLGGEHTPIGSDGTVDISPSARYAIKEAEIIMALYKGLKLLSEKEAQA